MMRCATLLCAALGLSAAADDAVSLIQRTTSPSAGRGALEKPRLRDTSYYNMTWHPNSMKDLQNNNLGGLGPGNTSAPEEMRFRNVSFLHTPAGDVALDLRITNVDTKYWSHAKLAEQGLYYEFGSLYTKKNRAQRFLVNLVYSGTETVANVESFSFTIFDIDDAPDTECTTTVAVWGADGYYIRPDAFHDMTVSGDQHWQNHTSAIMACSNVFVKEGGIVNPTYVNTISHQQARAAIVYHFKNTGEFEFGLHSKKLRQIFFVGADNPLEWEGIQWHEVFEPIVHPVILPGHGQLFRWNLDQEAKVRYNNLGGRGPSFDDPHQIRYCNVGELITHSNHSSVTNGSNTSAIINTSMIDLVVIIEEQYWGSEYINAEWNGANGEFGEIGLSRRSNGTFVFTFVYHNTSIPAISPFHDFVLFDIDNMADPSLGEEYIVYGAKEYWLPNSTFVEVVNASVPGEIHLKSNVTILDGAIDNPISWGNLTENQSNVAAHFRYYDTATWRVKFIATATTQRAFLFSGQSRPALPELAPKTEIETTAPTPSPTRGPRGTPSPTVLAGFNYPTASPTQLPNPSTYGDPHVKNLQGEAFDINRASSHTFLQIPRGARKKSAQLYVRGAVTPRGGECSGQLYLTRLFISGQWLGSVGSMELSSAGEQFDVPEAVGLKVGDSQNLSVEEFRSRLPPKMANVTQPHPEEPIDLNKHVTTLLVRLYLGPTILRLSWEHQKEKNGYSNSLMLLTYGLGNVTGEVGGLLGKDDHKWAASKPASCSEHGSNGQTLWRERGSCCVRAQAVQGEP